ncbi:hypothetical protein M405DRAFT_636771 [Rhizopogon salebrosus TDB-379]|nr:hypothetical protein M405DRAFT_636771 [Rhizopogon salebrosus TDB-379]
MRFALSELCTQLHQTQASLVDKVSILAEHEASKSKSQPSGTSSTLAPRAARQHHRDMGRSRLEPGKRMMMARSRMKAKRIKSAEEGLRRVCAIFVKAGRNRYFIRCDLHSKCPYILSHSVAADNKSHYPGGVSQALAGRTLYRAL